MARRPTRLFRSSRSDVPARNTAKFRFRVMLEIEGQALETLWLTDDYEYARSLALQVNRRVPGIPAWVEERVAADGPGRWVNCAQEEARGREQPAVRSGDVVVATLRQNKTRSSKWIAFLWELFADGPITNSEEVPPQAKAGDWVRVRVGAVNQDSTHLQFHWCRDESYLIPMEETAEEQDDDRE